MSYDPQRSASFDFGELFSRKQMNYTHLADYEPKMEIPADAFEGWQHFNEYHICWICGNQGHESDMIRNKLHYWVHEFCQDAINLNTENI